MTHSGVPGGNAAPAVSARGLHKRYDEVEAVKGVDFEVEPGEIFGFLGPNGAGKSTVIKMLCTLLTPTGGSASVGGYDVVHQRQEVRRTIGLVFQEQTLDRYLTGRQNLRFHAEIYAVPKHLVEERIDRAIETVGLGSHKDRIVGTYSGGLRRRLEIARGLLHSPRVLFLDEPTIGLDPQTRQAIWEGIREINERDGVTVFMTTHYLEEAENCQRIAIIDEGSIAVLDSPRALKESVGKDRVEMVSAEADALGAVLLDRFGIAPQIEGENVVFTVAEGEEFVPRLFADLKFPVRSIRVTPPSLDDVFLEYTGSTIRAAEAQAEHSREARAVAR
ncbi:ATP-binding cassette domain-containing protein [Nocardiopsis ansamitocini]|uniref:Daunorubicin resistance protein DrrA family ABC transporter ATP-binding protein n=1 Tax=Nocardiopsis ansamitocini TaxID=1670832 RepID=A0A9W6UIL0_9ACTN|nr:ATP-binding cassette domain-containing protein [Nocardiopsis ansamitocini]GLU50041.1 daunorubicin resistance protein DrrA family ABC transporter ATP-binding protein [Nocardiopsis ansamitocini]